MSDSGNPGFSYTRIPSAPTATNPDTLFVQVPGNPRYLTFRSYSLLAPKPAAARPYTEPPALRPPPPPPPPPPARLYPVTPAADPEELSAELCQAMDFIMSGMTPDELSRLFQVSDRYRNYNAAKIARHAPPPPPPPPPPAHDDPGRALYEYRAARDAARAAASHSLPTTYRQASPVLATATAGGAAEILADGVLDAAMLAAPEIAISALLAPPAFGLAEAAAKVLRSSVQLVGA